MKKAIIVSASIILIVAVIVSLAYFLSLKEEEQMAPYTVVGTLAFAPWHAITPGVSVMSSVPSLSPSPGPLTFAEPNGQGGTINYTVDAFMMVSFKSNFTFPQGTIGFPMGFEENEVVKLTGDISFDQTTQLYAMNVTSISHYIP